MDYDYLVIGAGISGSAAAYELAALGTVALIEAESTPGYHSTGRSAALFTPNYGVATVRRINKTSQAFFLNPPAEFCDRPLLTQRGMLTVAAHGEEDLLAPILDLSTDGYEIRKLDAAGTLSLAPLLRRERVAASAFESGVMDIDVASLHQGFLRGIRRRGGLVLCGKRITKLDRRDGLWKASAGDFSVKGRIIVNAAGAWAGEIGDIAGAGPIGLVAKRRTAIIVDGPPGLDIAKMPAVDYVAADAYIKPDAGRIMASPGDQTPIEPQDIQPDEWDVAVLVDWLQRETQATVSHIAKSWAGLRSFVADQAPVLGYDAAAPDFFWLAGQGGYGIMMAPALGRAAADLIVSGCLPADLLANGLSERDLSPARLAQP
ncbi:MULTISPECIES: NAD(P)/FAD-dependent oxidoreductase [Mesorhizobium]|uniref:NAD(P)/FAD-dependent oxidoreductase n=1 Tax=Mesorhizobium TaxID=68287 RepID=UPI0010A94EB0|nr:MULTISPECIES: FAD-binding oxidoreductase [Mesorhizobium]